MRGRGRGQASTQRRPAPVVAGRPACVDWGDWPAHRRRVTRSDYNPIKQKRVMYRRPSVSPPPQPPPPHLCRLLGRRQRLLCPPPGLPRPSLAAQ